VKWICLTARSLALGGVGHGVVMVTFDRTIGLPTTRLDCFLRRLAWDQTIAAAADEIAAAFTSCFVIGSTPVWYMHVAMSIGTGLCVKLSAWRALILSSFCACPWSSRA
jgi:hypothetical protein